MTKPEFSGMAFDIPCAAGYNRTTCTAAGQQTTPERRERVLTPVRFFSERGGTGRC